MKTNALDHVNIRTPNLAATVDFYESVLGLSPCDPPAPLDPAQFRWMKDQEGRAIIHLSSKDADTEAVLERAGARKTGPLHHVALRCTGHDAMIARLDGLNIDYQCSIIDSIGVKQIFVSDPNGVLLELNYHEVTD